MRWEWCGMRRSQHTLKTGKGATSQGMWANSRSWKRKQILRSILPFQPTEIQGINLYWFKPLHFWEFIAAAIESEHFYEPGTEPAIIGCQDVPVLQCHMVQKGQKKCIHVVKETCYALKSCTKPWGSTEQNVFSPWLGWVKEGFLEEGRYFRWAQTADWRIYRAPDPYGPRAFQSPRDMNVELGNILFSRLV